MKQIYKDITILTVTHNSERVIESFLKNIDKKFNLIVVDNNSLDNTKLILKKDIRPYKTLFFNQIGLGFGSGANVGLKKIKTKFILLVNPDTIIKDEHLEKLYYAANKYPNAALLAPLHVNDNGNKHIPSRNFFFNKVKYHNINLENFSGDCSVEHLSGAILLINKMNIDKIGYFDEKIFLYYEDDDLCIRSKHAGYENILVHDVIVGHLGGGSIGPPNFKNQWEKNFHINYSRCYIEKKYFGFTKSMLIAVKIFCTFLIKFLGHIILLQFGKLAKDIASMSGAASFLIKGN
jgi:N-acetylglucosaminyl-diphospho-decaprenol L-rhamnosyltransferase